MSAMPARAANERSLILSLVDSASTEADPEVRVQVRGESVVLRGDTARAVLGLLRAFGEGTAVNVEALPEVLTTGQAADLLGVSRPTVVALIESGKLPATRTGTHRRLQLSDVLALRERQVATRREALRELTQVSGELGLYDE
jgi:excisionase family DNA binding protein